jgi:hypothetical protein
MNPLDIGRSPWIGDQPIARPLRTQGNTSQKNAYIHASSGIRIQDSSVRAVPDLHDLDRTAILIG